ncbi:MAG: hypothetical protein GVY08_06390 [Bacteroidetes bacterium]|jgi:hypothetical protein|nr:hypothetical protein [Bacteroidota bacterium]
MTNLANIIADILKGSLRRVRDLRSSARLSREEKILQMDRFLSEQTINKRFTLTHLFVICVVIGKRVSDPLYVFKNRSTFQVPNSTFTYVTLH